MSETSPGPVVDALQLVACEGQVVFASAAPVRRLASATLRGLTGWLLAERYPDLAARYFKPGQGNDHPPAYLFAPLNALFDIAPTFPFRLVTWDPGHELLPAIQSVLTAAVGLPFGEAGATIAQVLWDEPARLGFTGYAAADDTVQITLRTPLQARHKQGWYQEDSLDLAALCKLAVSRINRLSTCYGNGGQLAPAFYLDQARAAHEQTRALRFVAPRRQSNTQHTFVNLSGLVGTLTYAQAAPPLLDLLAAVTPLHLGRHTPEGCGAIGLREARDWQSEGYCSL